MFVRIHFDAASLFPAMVIMTSFAVTLKRLRHFRRQHGHLNGRFVETNV